MTSLDPTIAAHAHDWDWMHGGWRVRHRRLKARLAGSKAWEEFDGVCTCWPTLGGFGNVDDNIIDLPAGTYRAVTMRAFDPAARQWSIWWLDARFATDLGAPVRGAFNNGVGAFNGDDTFEGRAIKVRFQWTNITTPTPRWEQAFSADGGETWETNWRMDFTRG